VTVWADVPDERRAWDGERGWWGNTLDDNPLFPVSRVPTEEEVEVAGLGDTKDRVAAEAMWDI